MKWIQKVLPPRHFILLLSLVVGLSVGLAANALKWLIHSIEHLLTENFTADSSNLLYLLYPAVGILITALFIKFIVRDNIGHGVTKILYALSRNQGFIRTHNCWSSIIASGITIGFGGSVGAESPIVLTGSAIGSRIGRWFNQDHRTLMILIGCGASAAVAGVFKAPIAGLVFTIEVLMIDLTMSSLVPLLIACASSTCVSYVLLGSTTMFHFTLNEAFLVERVPGTIILGIVCGLLGLYFTHVMNRLEAVFTKIGKLWRRFALGASILALLIFLFPPLYGEGYHTISTLLNSNNEIQVLDVTRNSFFYGHNELLLLYLGLIVLLKVFATTATNGGGGCGGTFAPSLFLGCVSGFIFARLWNLWQPFGLTMSSTNSALYGMAGMMSAIFHAPLTGIFLIAELTGGYQLLVPLMIVAATSYLTIRCFEAHSIYSMRLARRGELLTHHKDQNVLTLMQLDDVTDKTRPVLSPEMSLGHMLQVVSNCKHLHFAVCATDQQLLGIINLNNLRHLIFRAEFYQQFSVQSLMKAPSTILHKTDNMAQIMEKFSQESLGTLPLIDEHQHYIGFVSRARLYSVYREVLKDFSEE